VDGDDEFGGRCGDAKERVGDRVLRKGGGAAVHKRKGEGGGKAVRLLHSDTVHNSDRLHSWDK